MALPAAVVVYLPWLQWGIVLALFFVSGIAWSFIFWVLPIIKLNHNSSNAASQLVETSHRGGLWLEPFNAGLAAMLAVITILVRCHPDATQAATWKFYAAASMTLVQVAWWERVFIFPLDRSIMTISNIECGRKESLLEDSQRTDLPRLHQMMNTWGWYHAIRAALPLAAAMIAFVGKVGS